MPFIIPITYSFLLPSNSAFLYFSPAADFDEDLPEPISILPYTPLATSEDEVGEEEGSLPAGPKKGVSLSVSDKLRLVKPLLGKYMLPLCVFPDDNCITSGQLTILRSFRLPGKVPSYLTSLYV